MYTKWIYEYRPAACFADNRYFQHRTHPRHLRLVGMRVLRLGHEQVGRLFYLAVCLRRANPGQPVFVRSTGGSTYGAHVQSPEMEALMRRLLAAVRIEIAMIGLHFCRSGRVDFHISALNSDGDGQILFRRLRWVRKAARGAMRRLVGEYNAERLQAGRTSIGNLTGTGRVFFVEREEARAPDQVREELPVEAEPLTPPLVGTDGARLADPGSLELLRPAEATPGAAVPPAQASTALPVVAAAEPHADGVNDDEEEAKRRRDAEERERTATRLADERRREAEDEARRVREKETQEERQRDEDAAMCLWRYLSVWTESLPHPTERDEGGHWARLGRRGPAPAPDFQTVVRVIAPQFLRQRMANGITKEEREEGEQTLARAEAHLQMGERAVAEEEKKKARAQDEPEL